MSVVKAVAYYPLFMVTDSNGGMRKHYILPLQCLPFHCQGHQINKNVLCSSKSTYAHLYSV